MYSVQLRQIPIQSLIYQIIAESKPNAKFAIPIEMQNAEQHGDPIPEVVVLDTNSPFVSTIKHLIRNMTKYRAKDRIQLACVLEEMKSLKGMCMDRCSCQYCISLKCR